ncbi:MAG: response regulator transcription factor, partial [Xanthomonadales bacterium]|nr:response regulator transcription factor [Xanthomonadales bacterium]
TCASALVVDDLAPSRDWLARSVARAFPGIAVRLAADIATARAQLEPRPDLALIDLGLPDGSGVGLIEVLAARGTLCVVATVFDDDAHLFPALRAGAEGYVLKDQAQESLGDLLRGIADGQPPLSPSIARRLLREFQPAPRATDDVALSPRETDVLRLIAKGLSVPEVATMLGLTRNTTAGYVKDVYRKLSVSSRAEATLEAARRRLVAPP